MEQKLDLIIEMIKAQGVGLNSKIDAVKEELLANDRRIEQKLDNLSNQVDNLKDYTYATITTKLDNLSNQVTVLEDYTHGIIETKLDNLSNQVTVLEDYTHDKCEAALDGWASYLEKQQEIGSNVTNLNSKTENHEIRITVLEDVLEA
ncbi:MAG: hypothetical protein IKT41_01405 [Clostridia bacterium]|nr:hypothetical protein [Clostridia bacterium]